MAKRADQGSGTTRERKPGQWEGRITLGRDPGTGKQIQKSVYGSTQKEVRDKMKALQASMVTNTYIEPSKLTVKEWVDTWVTEYLGNVKEATKAKYTSVVKVHIIPALGAVKLQKLKPPQIQAFYNSLLEAGKSPKTVRDVNGVLHSALERAVKVGYINRNPVEACTLPRWKSKEVKVMDDSTVTAFLQEINGHRFEAIYFIDLFTGMRLSEILGLPWSSIDFKTGVITISQQLLKERHKGGCYYIDVTKNSKPRRIKPAPVVMQKLKERKKQQVEQQLKAGRAWQNNWGLVFTDELGKHLAHNTVRNNYKAIIETIGKEGLRFHDMRHSFAVISLMNGDDIKTVQGNLGHHTAAFTLDTYAHVTEKMQSDSANRMDEYIKQAKKA